METKKRAESLRFCHETWKVIVAVSIARKKGRETKCAGCMYNVSYFASFCSEVLKLFHNRLMLSTFVNELSGLEATQASCRHCYAVSCKWFFRVERNTRSWRLTHLCPELIYNPLLVCSTAKAKQTHTESSSHVWSSVCMINI